MYQIQVHDRLYQSWKINNLDNDSHPCGIAEPFQHKLFSEDVFTVGPDGTPTVVQSRVRDKTILPGVLILHGNKTYGREKKSKHAKLLYKCIPNDPSLPSFLIPYEMKHLAFSKVYINLYVLFHYEEWVDKHPVGRLQNVIGPVDALHCFYEYQLHCKKQHISIQPLTKYMSTILQQQHEDDVLDHILQLHPSIQDRTHETVITIDPADCQDYDDAISIQQLHPDLTRVSVYISNVAVILDYFHAWPHLSKRVATIYLPDTKRPMLSSILSDNLCSLRKNKKRIVFGMDLCIDRDYQIRDITFYNSVIRVSTNYVYEEPHLLHSETYQQLMRVMQLVSANYTPVDEIKDSHDLVAYAMKTMNQKCAAQLTAHHRGILRRVEKNEKRCFSEEVSRVIPQWNNYVGIYVDCATTDQHHHALLHMDAYTHVTSPIRRLVDLLNMIVIQDILQLVQWSDEAHSFYIQWVRDLDYINTSMRSIQKIQNTCALLDMCSRDAGLLEKTYECYLFDQRIDSHTMHVYIPKLNIYSSVKWTEANVSPVLLSTCKLYTFHNEDTYTKKIRVQLNPSF